MQRITSINEIIADQITKLDYSLLPPTFSGSCRNFRHVQDILGRVIDSLGEESSTSQGLNKVITTANKLKNTPDQFLYVLKDPAAKEGKGDLIGMLKVGKKHLYLLDENSKMCEVEALCVLDFYVQEGQQRRGFGKLLYDFMMKDNGVGPHEIAIDGPSQKMEQFVQKSYGIDCLVRQRNNFAVSPQFFSLIPTMKSGRATPAISRRVGRFAAQPPPSAIASVIHGGEPSQQGPSTNNGATTPEPESEIRREEYEVEPPNTAVRDPDEKSENEPEKSPERPSTLSVQPISDTTASAPSPAGSTISRRDSQLTDRGYFDVKFYHNKLW